MELNTAAQAYGALIGLDVRFGSKADMCAAKGYVCFTPNSDINRVFRHVCFGPKADIPLHS
jgi:hypothetical protein